MAHEYSIAKRDKRETYHLGPPVMNPVGGMVPANVPHRPMPKDPAAKRAWVAELSGLARDARLRENASRTKTVLWSAWSPAGAAETFQLTASDRDLLADWLFQGAAAIRNRYQADIVAREVIAWAGDAELALVRDGEYALVEHLGFAPDGYRQAGSIADTLGVQLDDATR